RWISQLLCSSINFQVPQSPSRRVARAGCWSINFARVPVNFLCGSINFEGGSVNFYGVGSTSKFHNQLQGVSLELDAGRSTLRGCRSTFCVNRSTLKVDQSASLPFYQLPSSTINFKARRSSWMLVDQLCGGAGQLFV